MKKTTIFIIIISSIIILSIFLIKAFPIFQPKSKPVGLLPLLNEEESKAKEVSEEIPFLKNVEIILVDKNNRCNWKLFVEIVEEKEEIRLLSRIKGEYYTLSGGKYLVEAAKGQLDEDFTFLNLSEEVTLLGPDLNLYAKELSWDSQCADEIVGKNLDIDYGGLTVKAEEFSLKPDDSELAIPGHSRSTFR